MACSGWIKKYSALKQSAVKVRYQAAYIAGTVLATQFPAPQTSQVALVVIRKPSRVGLVHGIIFTLLGHAQVVMTQHIGPDVRIQREAEHSSPGSVNEHRRRPINDITRRDLFQA